MNIEDRVKQTATAVDTTGGTYNIQLHGGTAAPDHQTFLQTFFNYEFVNGFSAAKKIRRVPVLIENGANWLLTVAELDYVSGTSMFIRAPLVTSHPAKSSAGWAFSTGVSVTVSVIASAQAAAAIHTNYNNILDGIGVIDQLRDDFSETTFPERFGVGGGAVSIGRSMARGFDAVAIGGAASANARNAIAIGNVTSDRVGAITMGGGVAAYNHTAFSRGLTGFDIAAGVTMNHFRTDGNLLAYTTDATVTPAQSRNEEGTVVTDSEWIYLEPGVNYFTAIVMAVDVTNNDTRVWELKFAAKNVNAYGAAALMGSLSKTTVAQDAGASAWDTNLVWDAVNDQFKFTVTGAAGKNIVWNVSYDQHVHTFWA